MWKRLIDVKRCVVCVEGFYEWINGSKPELAMVPLLKKRVSEDGSKTPHFVKRIDGKPLYLAGLYDIWESEKVTDFAEDNGEEE